MKLELDEPANGAEAQSSPRRFDADAMSAFTAVRKSLAELVASIPGDVRRPCDLERILRIDYKLCLRVFNIIRSVDSVAAASQVPKPASVRNLLHAAQRQRLPGVLITAVESAVKEFEDVVAFHAGERTAFDAMVCAIAADDGMGQIDPIERRTAFRCNSHIWGLQLDTFCLASFVRPSASGQGTDECVLNLKQGLRCLRPGVSLPIFGYSHYSATQPVLSQVREPLDAETSELYGAPLLRDFCTQPMPHLRTVRGLDGWIYYELDHGQIGRTSAVDLALGGIARDVPMTLDADGRQLCRSGVTFHTPTALVVADFYVHRPSYGKINPELMVFKSTPGDECRKLPCALSNYRQGKRLLLWAPEPIRGRSRRFPDIRK